MAANDRVCKFAQRKNLLFYKKIVSLWHSNIDESPTFDVQLTSRCTIASEISESSPKVRMTLSHTHAEDGENGEARGGEQEGNLDKLNYLVGSCGGNR
jgi:hypothetical protein